MKKILIISILLAFTGMSCKTTQTTTTEKHLFGKKQTKTVTKKKVAGITVKKRTTKN
jgi:hypothetical protein